MYFFLILFISVLSNLFPFYLQRKRKNENERYRELERDKESKSDRQREREKDAQSNKFVTDPENPTT